MKNTNRRESTKREGRSFSISQTQVGVAMVLFATIGFSAKAILVKLSYPYGVDTVTLLALRMVFSLPFFIAAAIFGPGAGARRLLVKDWVAISGLGFLGYYLASLLDFAGLQYISAGLERLILFLYPTLAVVLATTFFKRKIRRKEIIAIVLSYAGIAIASYATVQFGSADSHLGMALVFGSMVSFAFYMVGSERVIQRVGARRFTAYAMIVSCALVLFQYAASHPISVPRVPNAVYGLSLLMAIFSTVIPAFLLSAGMSRIGTNKTVILTSIGPLSTIGLAAVFLGEAVSLSQMAGTVLVLAGVLQLTFDKEGTKQHNAVSIDELSTPGSVTDSGRR